MSKGRDPAPLDEYNKQQRVRMMAHRVIDVYEAVGRDRFTFSSAAAADGYPSLPQAPTPDGQADKSRPQRLYHAGALEKCGKIRAQHHGTSTRAVQTWRLTEWAVEVAEEEVDKTDTMLPCGHRGIRNLRGTGYECMYDGCNETFTRDQISHAGGPGL